MNEREREAEAEAITPDADLVATAGAGSITNDTIVNQIVETEEFQLDELDSIVASILSESAESEGGLEDIFGRNEGDAETGKWVAVSEMGEPGDLVRRLQIKGKPIARFRIAKIPNKRFNKLIDLLQRRWQQRHRDQLPIEKVRLALPAIYAQSVLTGIENVFLRKGDSTPLSDNFEVRSSMLRKYDPELLDAVEKYGKELKNFQDKPADDGGVAAKNF